MYCVYNKSLLSLSWIQTVQCSEGCESVFLPSWRLFPGRHEGRSKRLRGPLDAAGRRRHAAALSDDFVRGHPRGRPRGLGGLLLQLGPRAQTRAGPGGGRRRPVRVAAESPTPVPYPAVPETLAQGVSEEGRDRQLHQPGGNTWCTRTWRWEYSEFCQCYAATLYYR